MDMDNLISPAPMAVVSKALDGLAKRHKAIASNLANVDTPGYRRQDVSFEENLQRALTNNPSHPAQQQVSNDQPLPMKITHRKHINLTPAFQTVNDVPIKQVGNDTHYYRNDTNAVDVENEMVQLAKNTQRYIALTNLQGRQGRIIRTAIDKNGG